jgi:hypothetical protein
MSDGTEVHVYGADDADQAFFGAGPVVGFAVESFASAPSLLAAFFSMDQLLSEKLVHGDIYRRYEYPGLADDRG